MGVGEQSVADFAKCWQGIVTGDDNKFVFRFWELKSVPVVWRFMQAPPQVAADFTGRETIIRWEEGRGSLHKASSGHNFPSAHMLGRRGIAVQRMRDLNATLFTGEIFGDHVAPIVVDDAIRLPAVWCFVKSPQYCDAVRHFDSSLKASVGAFLKPSFDLPHWQAVAAEKYPNGLPSPFSSDPTQWLFSGHPKGSDSPLHVAIARLLGYQWPRQTGSSFPDCPALGPDGLDSRADNDGIVCINPIKGEQPASERLRALLSAAFGANWTDRTLSDLLAKLDYSGSTLEDFLRNGFLDQHCRLFHQRPFIWQIWDGRRDGFSALVNYHKLDRRTLEKLIYTYLGDWITRQRAAVQAGEEGSDARLESAQSLKKNLELILLGDAPYDIFIRWKPLDKQPIGWDPDLNDGVRLNIRPFVTAGVLRKNPKVNWNKDRGKDVKSAPWFSVFKGERVNDWHLGLGEKRKVGKESR